jgi:hypothetical protein
MDYFRKATATSPLVMMDSKTKTALISGIATCEDISLYALALADIKYLMKNYDIHDLSINLKVFNTKAAKYLLDLLRYIKDGKSKAQTMVHWYHDEEDVEMQEMAQDYSALLEMMMDISIN